MKRGVTLIELLVAIALLGMLFQLMLPAVEASREAARRGECQNNLHQLGVAAQMHLSAYRFFPSGGWTSAWVGDPTRGASKEQPGGWTYNSLPFVGEEALHDMGKSIQPRLRRVEGAKMFATPVSAFVCPSRRSAQSWPFIRALFNVSPPNTAGRSDYAANIGNRPPTDQRAPGPPSYRVANTWQEGDNRLKNWVATKHNGVVFQRSMVTPPMVTNGLSKTFLAGEKFLSVDHYEDGESNGDDQSLYVGFDRDNARSTNELHPPMRDAKIESSWYAEGDDASVVDWNFGSAHSGACNMLFCDGSVIPVVYEVDMRVFSAQGSRAPD